MTGWMGKTGPSKKKTGGGREEEDEKRKKEVEIEEGKRATR